MKSNEIFAEKVVHWFQGTVDCSCESSSNKCEHKHTQTMCENNTDPPAQKNLNVLNHVSCPIGYPRAGLFSYRFTMKTSQM